MLTKQERSDLEPLCPKKNGIGVYGCNTVYKGPVSFNNLDVAGQGGRLRRRNRARMTEETKDEENPRQSKRRRVKIQKRKSTKKPSAKDRAKPRKVKVGGSKTNTPLRPKAQGVGDEESRGSSEDEGESSGSYDSDDWGSNSDEEPVGDSIDGSSKKKARQKDRSRSKAKKFLTKNIRVIKNQG